MRWLRAFVLVCCVSGSVPGSADPPTLTDRRMLESRLATLERAPEATVAAEALRQARRALERERQYRNEGREPASVRARRIADAAVILAERLIARARAEASLREAIAERDEAIRRKEVAEAALERAE